MVVAVWMAVELEVPGLWRVEVVPQWWLVPVLVPGPGRWCSVLTELHKLLKAGLLPAAVRL